MKSRALSLILSLCHHHHQHWVCSATTFIFWRASHHRLSTATCIVFAFTDVAIAYTHEQTWVECTP